MVMLCKSLIFEDSKSRNGSSVFRFPIQSCHATVPFLKQYDDYKKTNIGELIKMPWVEMDI